MYDNNTEMIFTKYVNNHCHLYQVQDNTYSDKYYKLGCLDFTYKDLAIIYDSNNGIPLLSYLFRTALAMDKDRWYIDSKIVYEFLMSFGIDFTKSIYNLADTCLDLTNTLLYQLYRYRYQKSLINNNWDIEKIYNEFRILKWYSSHIKDSTSKSIGIFCNLTPPFNSYDKQIKNVCLDFDLKVIEKGGIEDDPSLPPHLYFQNVANVWKILNMRLRRKKELGMHFNVFDQIYQLITTGFYSILMHGINDSAQVHHIDGYPLNNKVENLSCVTDNINYSKFSVEDLMMFVDLSKDFENPCHKALNNSITNNYLLLVGNLMLIEELMTTTFIFKYHNLTSIHSDEGCLPTAAGIIREINDIDKSTDTITLRNIFNLPKVFLSGADITTMQGIEDVIRFHRQKDSNNTLKSHSFLYDLVSHMEYDLNYLRNLKSYKMCLNHLYLRNLQSYNMCLSHFDIRTDSFNRSISGKSMGLMNDFILNNFQEKNNIKEEPKMNEIMIYARQNNVEELYLDKLSDLDKETELSLAKEGEISGLIFNFKDKKRVFIRPKKLCKHIYSPVMLSESMKKGYDKFLIKVKLSQSLRNLMRYECYVSTGISVAEYTGNDNKVYHKKFYIVYPENHSNKDPFNNVRNAAASTPRSKYLYFMEDDVEIISEEEMFRYVFGIKNVVQFEDDTNKIKDTLFVISTDNKTAISQIKVSAMDGETNDIEKAFLWAMIKYKHKMLSKFYKVFSPSVVESALNEILKVKKKREKKIEPQSFEAIDSKEE